MKKSIFYLFAVICTMCLFTACSDDDDNDGPLTVDSVVGTYKGTLTVLGAPTPDTSISLIKVSDSKVTIELKDFSFLGQSLGDIVVEGCDAKQNGNKMDIDGSGNVSIVLGTFPVVVDGSSDGKTLNITINIAGTPAGDLAVSYVGNK